MSKCTLIVDPLPTQRRRFCDALSARTLAYAIANSNDLPRGEVFDVYLIALRQATGHGLQLGKELKARFPKALVIVYGRPDGNGKASRSRVAELWRVDLFIPFVPEAADVPLIIRAMLKGEQPALQPPFTGSGPVPEGLRSDPPARALKGARTLEPTDDEPSWSEIFSAPLSADTFRQILRKDIFGRAQKSA